VERWCYWYGDLPVIKGSQVLLPTKAWYDSLRQVFLHLCACVTKLYNLILTQKLESKDWHDTGDNPHSCAIPIKLFFISPFRCGSSPYFSISTSLQCGSSTLHRNGHHHFLLFVLLMVINTTNADVLVCYTISPRLLSFYGDIIWAATFIKRQLYHVMQTDTINYRVVQIS